jgi:hypothetical protein
LAFDVVSEYGKLLGDIAVTLADAQVPEFPAWIIVLLLTVAALVAASVFRKKRA